MRAKPGTADPGSSAWQQRPTATSPARTASPAPRRHRYSNVTMDTTKTHPGIWLAVGGLFVAVFAGLGYTSSRPDSITAGAAMGAVTAGLILAARRSWLRHSTSPAPEAEYLVAVWAMSYIALVAIVASGRAINLADAFIISPPLGILPLALRVMLGDDGHPAGRARTAAHRLHLVLGWLHIAAGVLAVITVFYVFVAPLQLIPGAFHLRASYRYGVRRSEPA